MIVPNGLCHCDHVVGHGQALALLTARVAASETLDNHVTDEIHSLAGRLQVLELARARFLQEGVHTGPPDHHRPGEEKINSDAEVVAQGELKGSRRALSSSGRRGSSTTEPP